MWDFTDIRMFYTDIRQTWVILECSMLRALSVTHTYKMTRCLSRDRLDAGMSGSVPAETPLICGEAWMLWQIQGKFDWLSFWLYKKPIWNFFFIIKIKKEKILLFLWMQCFILNYLLKWKYNSHRPNQYKGKKEHSWELKIKTT